MERLIEGNCVTAKSQITVRKTYIAKSREILIEHISDGKVTGVGWVGVPNQSPLLELTTDAPLLR